MPEISKMASKNYLRGVYLKSFFFSGFQDIFQKLEIDRASLNINKLQSDTVFS